jgi:Superfamily II DNA/RNA helicases, SNF2 family
MFNQNLEMPEIKTRLKSVSLAHNEQGKTVIKIKFHYDLAILNKVRSLIGRQFHKEEDCWSAPLFVETLETLKAWGFTLSEGAETHIKQSKEKVYSGINIPNLKGTLRPFQSACVEFYEDHNGCVLNADEMGLGKTIETLAWLQLHRDRVPVVVITPASAKLNWEEEAKIWLPNPKAEVLIGTTPYPTKAEILIINYDIFPFWADKLLNLHPQVLVMDEIHFIKNNSAKRTKAVKRFAKHIPYRIGLSGTPIENRPVEIHNAWWIIDPDRCPTFWSFTEKFCGRKHGRFGWDNGGASHTKRLHSVLTSTIMIRRKKIDVLPELPAKQGSFVPLLLHNKEEYRAAERDFITFLAQTKGHEAAMRALKAEAMVKIEVLKQLATKGKQIETIQWIRDFLDVEDKLVVMAIHTSMIDALMEAFPNIAVRFDGSCSATKKQKAKNDFQTNPKIKLFVGQIKSAGVAITLTAANNIAIIEFPWTPGALDQAIDRIHRIGQEKLVTAYYLMARGTIEERIAQILDEKRKVLAAVLDGEDVETTALLMELMKEFYNKN